MTKQQLQMSFDGSPQFRSALRTCRPSRARWWFAQIRQVVDQALDWAPAPPPRPQQTQLTLAPGR